MAYCVIDDLSKVFPESELIRLTDDAGSGAIDDDVAQEAVDLAATEIDAYIGSIVALPITSTVPPILVKLNVDLAIYNLFARVSTDVPETWQTRHKDAIRLLERINEGKLILDIQPQPDAPLSYPQGIRVGVRTKVFSITELDKF